MLKLVEGQVPSHSRCQKYKFETTTDVLLSEGFETIQNQSRLEAITEESEHHVQTVTLAEITMDNMLEIYPLQDFENKNIQNEHDPLQVVDMALQSFIEILLMDDQDTITGTTAKKQPSQATAPHWIPSLASPHTPAQQYKEHMEPNPKRPL